MSSVRLTALLLIVLFIAAGTGFRDSKHLRAVASTLLLPMPPFERAPERVPRPSELLSPLQPPPALRQIVSLRYDVRYTLLWAGVTRRADGRYRIAYSLIPPVSVQDERSTEMPLLCVLHGSLMVDNPVADRTITYNPLLDPSTMIFHGGTDSPTIEWNPLPFYEPLSVQTRRKTI